jgi:hypothetical protein
MGARHLTKGPGKAPGKAPGAAPGIGHNAGPTLEPGRSWRRHCWGIARGRLLPTLPVEVVRLRVRRAREIGLDYRTYAGIRAGTGHDLVAFLFSTNALDLLRDGDRLTPSRAAKLRGLVSVATVVAARPPLDPDGVARVVAEDAGVAAIIGPAPGPWDGWGATRAAVLALAARAGTPADRILIIGADPGECLWAEAARAAAFLPAESFFAQMPGSNT